jgi:monoamine oxidase
MCPETAFSCTNIFPKKTIITMRNNTKTPFAQALKKILCFAFEANKRQLHTDDIFSEQLENTFSRRDFLAKSAKTLAVSTVLPNSIHFFNSHIKPKIAIVGGGIAGLNALHHLKKKGLDATIYESSGRIGGRMFTVPKAMGEGTWTEFGGEFIDTNHKDMWDLAKEFNLEMLDYAQPSEAKLTKEAYFFEGKHHTLQQVVEAFRHFAPRLKADMDKLPDDISYKTKDPFTQRLDHISVSEYLEKIGAKGWIKRFIEVAYESEYGLPPEQQSSLNLLLLLSPNTEGGQLELFGESDERYKIKGGNQSIPEALAQKYADHIELNRSLESIQGNSFSGYTLQFSGKSEAMKADMVILTLPFTKLRNVDIRLRMPQVKWDSINKLGYGVNAKLMLGMNNHLWRQQGYSGLTYADNGIPNGWDNAQLQTSDNAAAGLSILFGGRAAIALGKGSVQIQKDTYLPKWERIYKGVTEAHNGKMARMHWSSYPHNLGSYVCPTVGQYTSIIGAEQFAVDNVFFAGEHCGGDFSGFMNGAAQSGREAAETIFNKIK